MSESKKEKTDQKVSTTENKNTQADKKQEKSPLDKRLEEMETESILFPQAEIAAAVDTKPEAAAKAPAEAAPEKQADTEVVSDSPYADQKHKTMVAFVAGVLLGALLTSFMI